MAAPSTFSMAAPGNTPAWAIRDRSGTLWTADNTGTITGVTLSVLATLIDAGCTLLALDGPGIAAYTANTSTSAATLTTASMVAGDPAIIAMTGTLGAGAVLTLPTVALLAAAAPGGLGQGATWVMRIINKSSGAFSWTLTTAAGWTLTGTMTIAQNTWREFLVTIAAGGTAGTIQEIGTGTDS